MNIITFFTLRIDMCQAVCTMIRAEPTFYIGRRIPGKAAGTVRIVVIGDTCNAEPVLPPYDILIHIGGKTTRRTQHGGYRVIVGSQPTKSAPDNDTIRLDGASTSIHGVTMTSATRNGVFDGGCARGDVLISTIPPYGMLDTNAYGKHVGSAELRYHIESTAPSVVVFGGNPIGHGAMWLGGGHKRTLCINAGIWSDTSPMVQYGVPLVFDMPSKKRDWPRRPYLG